MALNELVLDESQLDGSHFVVPCSLSSSDLLVQISALVDCGATGFSFVDEDFARRHHLPLSALREPRTVEVIDGRPIESGAVTHIATVTMTTRDHVTNQDHTEVLPLFA